jgi:hypothetical protein
MPDAPRIVEAVGVANPGKQPLSLKIQAAMEAEIKQAYGEGVIDSLEIHRRMMGARERFKRHG